MKTFIAFLGFVGFLMTTASAGAQIVWKGGTPGAENKWEEARNWSTQKVPGAFDEVIIPDLSTIGNFYPEIHSKVEAIAHLTINGNAYLSLNPDGVLIVDGSHTYNNGITLVGYLYNQGQINIIDPAMQAIEILRSQQLTGSVAIINTQTDLLADK